MKLDELRSEISKIDSEIIKLLSKRKDFSLEVIKVKDQAHAKIVDEKREQILIDKVMKIAEDEEVNPEFIKRIYFEIIDESVRIQKNYMLDKEEATEETNT